MSHFMQIVRIQQLITVIAQSHMRKSYKLNCSGEKSAPKVATEAKWAQKLRTSRQIREKLL